MGANTSSPNYTITGNEKYNKYLYGLTQIKDNQWKIGLKINFNPIENVNQQTNVKLKSLIVVGIDNILSSNKCEYKFILHINDNSNIKNIYINTFKDKIKDIGWISGELSDVITITPSGTPSITPSTTPINTPINTPKLRKK